jgi:hypothetical protein
VLCATAKLEQITSTATIDLLISNASGIGKTITACTSTAPLYSSPSGPLRITFIVSV